MVCNQCAENKVFMDSGRKTKTKVRIMIDDKGVQWSGRTCGQCRSGNKKVKRANMKFRKCKSCGVKMINRYFECEGCKPVLGDSYYEGEMGHL